MLLIDVKGGAHGSQKSKSWKNELSRADFILHTKTMQIRSEGRRHSASRMVSALGSQPSDRGIDPGCRHRALFHAYLDMELSLAMNSDGENRGKHGDCLSRVSAATCD